MAYRDRMRARREKLGESGDSPKQEGTLESTLNATLDTLGSSDEYPSDADIQEAEDLKKDLTIKHKERKKELARQYRSRSREDLHGEMKTAKERSRAKLEESLKAGEGEGDMRRRRKKKKEEEKEVEEGVDVGAAQRTESGVSIEDGGVAMDAAEAESKTEAEAEDQPRRGHIDRKALAASMREKLKAKIQAEADAEVQDELEATAPRKFRGQRDLSMGTRFEEGVGMEDDFIRSKREKEAKALTWEDLKQKAGITEEESYDFFTREWEAEVEEVVPLPVPGVEGEVKPEGEGEEVTGPKEDEVPLLEAISNRYKSKMDFVGVGRADYIPHNERLQAEEKFLYTPSVVEVQLAHKIEHQPRYKEEEGLYVGRPPIITMGNRRRLENRLVTEGKLEWFGEDGQIELLPDPLKEIPFRPLVWDDQTNPTPEELRTEYVHPIASQFTRTMIDARLTDAIFKIEIDLHSIVFGHHHLFSREHVLAQRLRQLFVTYERSLERDMITYCDERLFALKRAVLHLEEQLNIHEAYPDRQAMIDDIQTRIHEYREEISKTRRTRNLEEGQQRQTLNSILQTWKQIKDQRRTTGFTNTQLKLKIQKETSNREEDEHILREEIEEEVVEERIAFEEEYQKKRKDYDNQLKKFEEQKRRKENALKRQKKRERMGIRPGENVRVDDELEEDPASVERRRLRTQEEDDNKALTEEALVQPEEPALFAEEEVRERIREFVQQNRRIPGEPKLHVTLQDGTAVTSDNLCRPGEQQRRVDLAKYSYFIKIYFNHKEVGTTELRGLTSDFTVNYTRIYPIQIVQYPEVIHLQLFEQRAGFIITNTLLAEIYLPAPSSQSVAGRVRLDGYEFTSSQVVTHRHEGVGSGEDIRLEAEGDAIQTMMTSGKLYASVAWSADEDGMPLAPPLADGDENAFSEFRFKDAVTAIGASGITDMEKLAKWVAEAKLDPNDPRNARLLHLLHGGHRDGGRLHMPEYFRLDHLQEEFNFATDEELNQSNRYRLLRLRDMEIPEFKHMRVPLTDKEVSPEIFKEYEARQKKKREAARGFEARRQLHQQYLDRIRDEVMLRFRQALHQKSLKEMVNEVEVPNIGAFFPELIKRLTEERRPLRPVRMDRKKVPPHNLSQMDVKVLVTIIGAQNVPIRKENEKTVHPFIEVRFQDEVRVTAVADGPNPSWNTELHVPFRCPPNVTSLASVSDVVLINLYDELVMDMLIDERHRDTDVHQRIEKHWLGSLEIPLATIYLNSTVEGKFMMNTPPSLLGYQLGTGTDEHGSRTLLSVFVTLEPAFQLPEPLKERFDSCEEDSLLTHSDTWLAQLNMDRPDRQRKCTVVDMKCNEVFITRYLTPLNPPEEIMNMNCDKEQTKHLLARYVSLIPFLSDVSAFPGMCDIWSTCDQFLRMLAGDEEEHAVLLCNYFLHVYDDPARVFLCLGTAIPEGPTAYVMTREEGSIFLWNSAKGYKFSVSDPHCPMSSIGCLINMENVWANVQEKSNPWEMRFDLSSTSDWRPLFGSKFRAPELATIQVARLVYTPPDQRDIDGLKFQIESTLRDRFMVWRKGQITKWNYEFMRDLSGILENLERNGGTYYAGMETSLNKITARYTMYGFPLNLPYMELEEIVSRVRATGIHVTTAKNVEFALSVYVKGYANSVLSIWIYVASLIYRRT